ncbi:hypothetical protein SDC9_197458 [bioreactor metagenome]|uniref:Uncharacterized protein n=1 Tax=bioreactor metagenome TaxID=1076179 RepID=A0A645IEX6_9ZZZZ
MLKSIPVKQALHTARLADAAFKRKHSSRSYAFYILHNAPVKIKPIVAAAEREPRLKAQLLLQALHIGSPYIRRVTHDHIKNSAAKRLKHIALERFNFCAVFERIFTRKLYARRAYIGCGDAQATQFIQAHGDAAAAAA